jgi:hypothetical protein
MALKKASIALIALIITAVALAIATSGALSSNTTSQTLPSRGTLTTVQGSINLGIYDNAGCTQNASFIDWGALKPGDYTTKTIYIKNLGTTNATLSLSTSDWTPSNASPDITLSWNQENRVIAPNEVIQATLKIEVSPSIDNSITTFSFNIQITGTT